MDFLLWAMEELEKECTNSEEGNSKASKSNQTFIAVGYISTV